MKKERRKLTAWQFITLGYLALILAITAVVLLFIALRGA